MATDSRLNRPIVVVDYDAQWQNLFEQEKETILAAVGKHIQMVEHIGSTAVPGLAAKPVIDIAVGIQRLEDSTFLIPCIERLGYVYEPAFEQFLPERRFFWKGTPTVHTHHLHLAEANNPVLVRPLQFRDYLRNHPEVAAEYAALKKGLANKYVQDIESYVEGKTGFVEKIMLQVRQENQ